MATVEVLVVPEGVTPIALDAIVEEEDTYLVLSAELHLEPGGSPAAALELARRAHALPPGSVALRRGKPKRLLAIVHDLSCSPTWREEWVIQALASVLRIACRLRLRSLSLPLLGSAHGRLDSKRFVSLLADALAGSEPSALERVWLRVPEDQAPSIAALVRALVPSPAALP